MESSGKIIYLLRKHPLLRLFTLFLIIGFILGTVYAVNYKIKPVPFISSIEPSVGSPGDVIIINGNNFGKVRGMNYVEIAGSKLTASSYISWSDDCIKIVLPANVQGGLLYVGTKSLKSKPALFANEVDIPVPVQTVKQVTKPFIRYLSADKVNVGDELTIYGNNFGEAKNQSKVYFTANYDGKVEEDDIKALNTLTENMVCANEDDFDYTFWSDTEIKVRVPDGAYTGVVIVDTGTEKSVPKNIAVNTERGRKDFINKKIYLLEYSADIADVVTSSVSTITLRCPVPFTTAYQPEVEITEIVPSPILQNYQNDIIHQVTRQKNNTSKSAFKQTFVLPVYEVRTYVKAERIGNYADTEPNLLMYALRSDELIPVNDALKNLAAKITGKEKNPYRKAKLIYDYMFENFKLLNNLRKSDSDPLDLLKKNTGDAYDFSIIFTALLRAAEIPALADAGIIVNQDLTTRVHWWSEFYIDKFGWVPVDIALACSLDEKPWPDIDTENMREYYFGNIDSHHIIFSRGLNSLKPFSADSKIVQRPRSFAFQTIWEEASDSTSKYSSFWSVPVIKGVY